MTASPILSTKVERVVLDPTVALALGGREIPGKAGWVATIEVRGGSRFVIDRLDTEPEGEWHINGHWVNGSFPKFWNGNLSRCTLPNMASPMLTADADYAVSMARCTGSTGATIRHERAS